MGCKVHGQVEENGEQPPHLPVICFGVDSGGGQITVRVENKKNKIGIPQGIQPVPPQGGGGKSS